MFSIPGWGLSINSLVSLFTVPLYFGAYGFPLVAAIAGLLLRRRTGWRGALARLAFGLAGFSGLMFGYLRDPGAGWEFWYYAATVALLVAAVGSALRLVSVITLGEQRRIGELPQPALSASQELLRRHQQRP